MQNERLRQTQNQKILQMQIYSYGWVLLPIGLFFIFKKYYLYQSELWLLIYLNFLLFSLFIDGWFMQVVYLIIVTAQVIQMLALCKESAGLLYHRKSGNLWTKIVFSFQQQFTIIIYVVALWILIRMYTIKNLQYGIGVEVNGQIFQGLLISLKGWNCTQLQHTIIPLFWVLILSISYYVGTKIIQTQRQKDHLYKVYLLKYKVVPDLVFALITCGYNFFSYLSSATLLQCLYFWQLGSFFHIFLYLGFPISTIVLFYKKHGVFQIQQNSSQMAQMDQKVQIEMPFIQKKSQQ